MKLWNEHLDSHREMTKRAARYPVPPFTCHTDPVHQQTFAPPTTVHQLMPGDVDVVAAMGDSLTAGNGVDANNILEDLIEFRGLSWSGGGDQSLDEGILTLPNILRKFNPSVYGAATGRGSNTGANARLNVANPGDTSFEMPGQADMLIERMRATTSFTSDWKVITLFIGGNDLCDACNDWNKYSPANYGANLQLTLDKLHAAVPRALVNVALIFDIAPVAQLANGNFWCSLAHALVCACGQDVSNAPRLRELTHGYQKVTEDLIASGRYNTRDDFTVVLQPFFKNTEPPVLPGQPDETDMSFFSADCFHFSAKGQGAAALSLWNNMCEPFGKKQEVWHLNANFTCPGSLTSSPYFATISN